MGLVLTVFLFVFAVIRLSIRFSSNSPSHGRMARIGEWTDYRNAHCDKQLEEKYHNMILSPHHFEEVWKILINAWENEQGKIMQMDESTIKLWRLLMEVPYAPFARIGKRDDIEFDRTLAELIERYKFYDYVDVWGDHQWMYNFLRAKHCMMTLHGLKSVQVAEYEWVKYVHPFDPPKDDLWTYDGRIEVERRKRSYGY